MTYGGMKSWRIYERCSINRVQTLNEAKMINKPQKPPCFIPFSAMSSGGIGTTHYQNITNEYRKHKR